MAKRFVLTLRPSGTVKPWCISGTGIPGREWMKEQTGGEVEIIPTHYPALRMLARIDGVRIRLPVNDYATGLQRPDIDAQRGVVRGNVILAGYDGETLRGLSESECEAIMEKLADPTTGYATWKEV